MPDILFSSEHLQTTLKPVCLKLTQFLFLFSTKNRNDSITSKSSESEGEAVAVVADVSGHGKTVSLDYI